MLGSGCATLPRMAAVRSSCGLFAVFVATLSLAGCGGPQKPTRQRSSLISETEAVRRFASPAHWHYHPRKAAALAARKTLPSGEIVFAGARGERWLFQPKAHRVAAASQLASETLIAALTLPDSHWLFVGASGTGYESMGPLDPFVRSSPPVEPLERVSASGSSIVGVRFDGALIQTTNAGLTWKRVPYPDRVFADVELGEAGTGVAFAVPEAWYATRDHGEKWSRLDVPPIGVTELTTDPKAGLVALGATSWFDVDPSRPDVFRARAQGPVDQGYELPVPPPRGPDAGALLDHRALLSGSRYLEVARGGEQQSPWQMVSGTLGEALAAHPLEFAAHCQAIRLAGFGRFVYLACFKAEPKDSAVPTDFYLSRDGGKRFKREPFSARAKLPEFGMAVGDDARLIVTGICAPQDSGRGCAPHGVFHKRAATPKEPSPGPDSEEKPAKRASSGPRAPLALSAVPGLARTPLAMVFSADGKVAYLVGQRTKSDNYTMFVSSDRGATFRAREIEQLGARAERSKSAPWYRRRKVSDSVLDMKAAEDGTLSVVIRRGEQVALAVTDDDGRVLSLTPGPGESTTLGAYGTRALAFSPQSGKAWETLDGGVSWQAIGSVPVDLCDDNKECEVPLICGPTGCVVGDLLTRVGWHGQAENDQALMGPPQSLTTGLLYPRVRTPLSCILDDEEWTILHGVADAPSAHEAAIGNTAWHLPAADIDSAAAWVYHGLLGPRQQVERATLLPPTRAPKQTAFAVFDQIEGAAVLRYRVPQAGEHELSAIEVAWDNRFEGIVKHATLPRRVPLESGDYAAQKAQTELARPDLVSIGAGGVYVRLHHVAADQQVTYFLDGRSTVEIPPVEWPSSPLAGRSEMVHVGGSHLPIRLLAQGATLTRASLDAGHWSFSSMSIGMPRPKDFGMVQRTGISYLKGNSTFYVLRSAPSGVPRSGLAFPIRATGSVSAPPVPIPEQADVSDPPVPCTDEQRADTTRVVAPYQAGTRHPVIISHRIEPIRTLLSVDAVLHGTPGAPCMAALAAVPIDMDDRDDRTWMYAVILPGHLDQAWAFRVVYDEAGEKQVSYRGMQCEFDPKAAIPKTVYAEPGTLSSEP